MVLCTFEMWAVILHVHDHLDLGMDTDTTHSIHSVGVGKSCWRSHVHFRVPLFTDILYVISHGISCEVRRTSSILLSNDGVNRSQGDFVQAAVCLGPLAFAKAWNVGARRGPEHPVNP